MSLSNASLTFDGQTLNHFALSWNSNVLTMRLAVAHWKKRHSYKQKVGEITWLTARKQATRWNKLANQFCVALCASGKQSPLSDFWNDLSYCHGEIHPVMLHLSQASLGQYLAASPKHPGCCSNPNFKGIRNLPYPWLHLQEACLC